MAHSKINLQRLAHVASTPQAREYWRLTLALASALLTVRKCARDLAREFDAHRGRERLSWAGADVLPPRWCVPRAEREPGAPYSRPSWLGSGGVDWYTTADL